MASMNSRFTITSRLHTPSASFDRDADHRDVGRIEHDMLWDVSAMFQAILSERSSSALARHHLMVLRKRLDDFEADVLDAFKGGATVAEDMAEVDFFRAEDDR